MPEQTKAVNEERPPGRATAGSGRPWSWMGGVFVDPKATFHEIADHVALPHPTIPGKTVDRSRWWLPLVVLFVIMIGTAAYVIPNVIMDPDTLRETMLERGVPPEQMDQAIQMARAFGVPIGIAGQVIFQLAFVFGAGGLLHLLMKITGSKGIFRHARAIVTYSMLIWAVGSIVKLPLMIGRGDPYVETGLVVLFKDLEPSQWLYRILFTAFDIFTLWWAVVLGVGAAAAYRASGAKATTAAVIVWALISLISAALMGGGGFGG